jgi:hypothetical protein
LTAGGDELLACSRGISEVKDAATHSGFLLTGRWQREANS